MSNSLQSKNPAIISLDSCDTKPVSLLNIIQETGLLKKPLTLFFNRGEIYSYIKEEYYRLGKICRQNDTFFSTPNEKFLSNK